MEVVVYGAVATFWWLSSLSVLLPFVLLLKISKTFRDKWFSFFFMNIVGPFFQSKLVPFRIRALELLKEHLKKEESRTSLEILEIGVAGGANLKYYPENSVLTVLDINESFVTYFRENQKKYPHITFKDFIHSSAEDMKEVCDSSMDIIICTYVLCSVDEIKRVLSEVKRVLKPGGKFVFLEHVAYPKSQWSFTIQKLLSPVWKLYFDGCNIDRNIADDIEGAGFSDVILERTYPSSLILYVRPHIIGMATK